MSWAHAESPGGRTYYLLAADVETRYDLTPADLYADGANTTSFVVYEWRSGKISDFGTTSPVELKPNSNALVAWSLYVISPVVDGWALIGDPTKYVTASTKRVESARVQPDGSFQVTVLGQTNEMLTACAYSIKLRGRVLCNSGQGDAHGSAVISLQV